MTNFEGYRLTKIIFFVHFLVLLINAVMARINHLSKSFGEKFTQLQAISAQQSATANQLKAENELLKLKQSKIKLAIENLLARTEMERKQIQDLNAEIEKLDGIETENETEVENLENKIAQKDREIFKKQLQIDLAKLQLQ